MVAMYHMPWSGISRCKESIALKKNCKVIGKEKCAL
jgi:hypothetical protein